MSSRFFFCHSRGGGNPEKNKNNFCLFSGLDPLVKPEDDIGSKGIPLGNLTSQLFANIYLDSLDKFVKHKLKARCYIRYADDFILLSNNKDELIGHLIEINRFLKATLKLSIHPNKIIFRKLTWGIDYVGYVALPHYSIPRRKTVKRIFKKVSKIIRSLCSANDSVEMTKKRGLNELGKAMSSYLGYLGHVDSYRIQKKLKYLESHPTML